MSEDIEYKDRGLKQLLKALKGEGGKTPVARVGILGDHNARTSKTAGGSTNAEIGAKHEFGDDGMPVRSFLRAPITDELQNFLEESGAFTKDVLAQVVAAGSVEAWVAKIGLTGEAVVAEAFNTGGFGKWKPSNMALKENKQTLVETQQLRNSITSDVTSS